MGKPPAFQFYVKDWRSSPTRQRMTFRDKAIFLELLALAWDSPEPGLIRLPFEDIARDVGVTPATLARHVEAFPTTCTLRVDGALAIPKLIEQFAKYKEISKKRADAAMVMHANAQQKGGSAFAVAFASEVKGLKPKEREEKPNYVPAALVVPVDLWLSFVEMRKKIRKPLTVRAGEMIAAKLRWFGEHDNDPAEVLSQSIMNSWAGVFPLKGARQNGTRESFEEQRQRKSHEAIGEVRTGFDGVVRKMDGPARLPSGEQAADSGVRGSTHRFISRSN